MRLNEFSRNKINVCFGAVVFCCVWFVSLHVISKDMMSSSFPPKDMFCRYIPLRLLYCFLEVTSIKHLGI